MSAQVPLQRLIQAVFWFAILFTFLSAELPETYAPPVHVWDKALHFGSFFVLATLGALAYPRALPWVAAGLALFGALIEVVQGLPVIHRDADAWDWVADVLGIASALSSLRLFGLPKIRRAAEPGR